MTKVIGNPPRFLGYLACLLVRTPTAQQDDWLDASDYEYQRDRQTREGGRIKGDEWCDDWKQNGFNHAITQAQKALRFLAENDRPIGGEQFPNSASCHMIADELEITRERYAALAIQRTAEQAGDHHG